MVPLATRAPEFALPDVLSGTLVTLYDVAGAKGTVIMFICNHCPFVKHVLDQLVAVGADYTGRKIGFAAISANDAEQYPEDAPARMKEVAQENEFPFPYLYDESQETAKAYGAACTPDLFVFDSALELVYRGQLDDSRPGSDLPVTGKDLRQALDALLAGKPVPQEQTPSLGCNIKWKSS